ncbi:O-antigen ligase family protein [Kosakonia sp. SOY2]|uniref:O-antigen ligase family protein n=1 Tax=Kosakonia sp. SOY2 TaxID=3014557 RepID=UPI0022ABF3B0|nr:O-antigen ligase family protein [Kosakonia sp. SOY2]MCZ3381148.1 O-antigen ligase family protein [Kosakonia sp. SOY2]
MLNIVSFERILLFLIMTTVGSPYLSSWLPKVSDMPIGPLIRCVAILLFYVIIIYTLFLSGSFKVNGSLITLFILMLSGTLLSIIDNRSNILQVVLGLHALVFYPMVFSILACYFNNDYDNDRWRRIAFFLKRVLTVVFLITSSIAIIDVVTGGNFTLMLGYNPNYGGDNFSLINRYYDLVRANGGFADALAFGYLMVIAFIFFVYKIFSKYGSKYTNLLGAILAIIACFMSITRGAIIALICSGLIFLCRSKIIVKASASLMAFVLLVAISLSSYSDIFIGRFTDSDKGSKYSTTQRFDMASNSIDFLVNHPLGEGLGSQGAGSTLSQTTERINTDNFIFHGMLEAGIFGGLMFQLLILYQFRVFYKKTKGARQFFFALFFLYWLSAAVSSSFQAGILSVLFWIVCFIIYSETIITRRESLLECGK